ncbi:hypothetical protein CDD81_4091 [Ophiocordyceps australis]|uniref:Lipoyl-binding domain-containing protein n=1 Tax=Ophiocordyceps australis TaxID=1399860 RepID=A0A2C5YB03_9HYPO|nr:hypothetical protein CDD81_4091 [Ophiocordyceps australis]
MASLATTCRVSARLLGRRAATRAFTTSSRCLAAQNFVMPALSPTMTEGNIASWSVSEGQSFSAGDVLLEIETDKATMDVEAQEDGVVFKILAEKGAKGVQVGARIAVLAEPGDDLASLEEPRAQASKAPDASPEPKTTETSSTPSRQPDKDDAATKGQTQHALRRPLLPSVEFLVHEHRIAPADVARIKPTGPGGRLLKGDVLAYLGAIAASSPAAVSSRFAKLAALDLSNIKVAAPVAPSQPLEPAPPPTTQLNMPVSLASVLEVQKRIHDSLGVLLPLSTFISRATDVANEALPRVPAPPTPSELFDQVLGLHSVKAAAGSRGVYQPQISALVPQAQLRPAPRARAAQPSLFDEIVGPRTKTAPRRAGPMTMPGLSSGDNVFSLVVPKNEEKRGRLFLERCKTILEKEPGRLVL